jgi:hypothetical protein
MSSGIPITGSVASCQPPWIDPSRNNTDANFPKFPWGRKDQTCRYDFSEEGMLTSSGTEEEFPLGTNRFLSFNKPDKFTVDMYPGSKFTIKRDKEGAATIFPHGYGIPFEGTRIFLAMQTEDGGHVEGC